MIITNSALYMGLVTACILERCPDALVHIARTENGYEVSGTRKVGTGTAARSFLEAHRFLDSETASFETSGLTYAARLAGDGVGARLAGAGA